MDESKLADLFMRSDDFAELERALDVFCPFEAIGMIRQEVRHAFFLANILDPRRPHGFGDLCLRAFIRAAVEASETKAFQSPEASSLTSLNIHLMDLQGAIVRRDWRQIDLLIDIPNSNRSPGLVIGIELKIDASESKGQLKKYERILQDAWPSKPRLLLFLTKAGDEAADEGTENWIKLTLESVVTALQAVVVKRKVEPQANALLEAYLSMLRRHHLSDEKLEKLAADLWSKHREALEFLVDRQPNILSDVISILSEQQHDIAEEISRKTDLNIISDDNSGTNIIRFAVEDWDAVDKLRGTAVWTSTSRFVLAELRAYRGEAVAGYVVLGRGNQNDRQSIYDRLKMSDAVKNPSRLGPEWKRLASKTFIRIIKDQDDLDSIEVAKKMRSEFVKWITEPILAYDKVLRPKS